MYHQLKEKRPIFFLSGLTVALAITFLAFEYQSVEYRDIYEGSISFEEDDIEVQMHEITLYTEIPEIPDPKPIKPKDVVVLQNHIVEPISSIEHTTRDFDFPDDFDPDNMVPMADEKLEPEPIPVMLMPEIPAEYITGEAGMMEFIQSFKLPDAIKTNNKELIIYVTFVVNEEGNVTDIETLREVGYGVDKRIEEYFATMPQWKPAKQGARNVKQRFNLPIRYIIN